MTQGGGSNVGIAFGAVFAAGTSTAVGAAIVFFPRLVKLASRRVLASSLGISAGVMTYVSFVEIFQKSVGAFDEMNLLKIEDDDKRFGRANLYATLSFFTGILVMILIDFTVKFLSSKDGSHDHDHHDISDSLRRVENGSIPGDTCNKKQEEVVVPPVLSCCRPDPVGDLESWQLKATEEENRNIRLDGSTLFSGGISAESDDREEASVSSVDIVNETMSGGGEKYCEDIANVEANRKKLEDEIEQKKLVRMGLQTAIAIALHNFPEGLATYVSVLNDPKIGAVLAIAIGIHNIPEGFCVALPIYYATGNRKKAFVWGALSGISEPIGAILGYLILANRFSSVTYGVMFGVVAGMMVMISLKELLPTAYRYDPGDTVVTNSLIAGMVVISMSLVLFYL
jgi:Predicted divalent heavy-metal cations transporter